MDLIVISQNITEKDRFIYFNEELVILAKVLKEYQDKLDQEDIPAIPLPTDKKVSDW